MRNLYSICGRDVTLKLIHEKAFTQEEFDELVVSCINPIIDAHFNSMRHVYVKLNASTFRLNVIDELNDPDDLSIEATYITGDLFAVLLYKHLNMFHGFKYVEAEPIYASFYFSEGTLGTAAVHLQHRNFDTAMKVMDAYCPMNSPDKQFLIAFAEKLKTIPVVEAD